MALSVTRWLMSPQLLFAQSASADWVSIIQTLGFPTVVACVVGWVVLSGKVPREAEIKTLVSIIEAKDKEKERLEAQVDAFARQYETVVLPTVHDAIGAIRETSKVIEQQTNATRTAEEALRRMESTLRAERSFGRMRRDSQ